MVNKEKHKKSIWGWLLILSGLIGSALGIYLIYQYFVIKASLFENVDTVWNGIGNIFLYASVGSSLLLWGFGFFLGGWIFFGIGLMILRSR